MEVSPYVNYPALHIDLEYNHKRERNESHRPASIPDSRQGARTEQGWE